VVKAAARNDESGNKVMQLLLERRGPNIQITDQVVEAIAKCFDGKTMRLLLEKGGPDVNITPQVVLQQGIYGVERR
jgi:hypothetical protein